jgi:hypothetical protein
MGRLTKRKAAGSMCLAWFIILDTIGHRLRELHQPSNRNGLLAKSFTEEEREYVGKLADNVFKVAQATRKFGLGLQTGE